MESPTSNNTHANGSDSTCFWLTNPFQRGSHHHQVDSHLLEERKDAIANLAMENQKADALQIVDLEYSEQPLLLLDVVEQLLKVEPGFNCSFRILEQETNAQVFMGNETPLFSILITHIHPQKAYRAVLSQNQLQIIEAFLNGIIDVQGDLIHCILTFQHVWKTQTPITSFWNRIFHEPNIDNPHSLHYDRWKTALLLALDNDFQLYSPGIYMYDEEDMEPASQRKLAHAFEQLQLGKNDTLLDIGCGYGGMLRYVAQKGCQVTGITLAKQQVEYAQQHTKTRSSAPINISVLCQDFFSYKPIFHHHHHHHHPQNHSNTPINTKHKNNGYETPERRRSSDSLSSLSNTAKLTPSPFRPSNQSPHVRTHQQLLGGHSQRKKLDSSSRGALPAKSNIFHSTPTRTNPNTTHPNNTTNISNGPVLYDAITLMGVWEELGQDYHRVLTKLTQLIKPGGRIYLEFAAERNPSTEHESYSQHPFMTQHVYPSSPSTPAAHWIHLPKLLHAIDQSDLVLESLADNRHNYHLWAKKCYEKLSQKEEEFLQQLYHQNNQKGTNSDTGTTLPTNASPEVGSGEGNRKIAAVSPPSPPSLFSRERQENRQTNTYLYRLMLAMFAGAAAAMANPKYQCTAYRMVLKLPEK